MSRRRSTTPDALRAFISFADSIREQALAPFFDPVNSDPEFWQGIGFSTGEALRAELNRLADAVVALSPFAWAAIHTTPDELDRLLAPVVWNLVQLWPLRHKLSARCPPDLRDSIEKKRLHYVQKHTHDAWAALEKLRPLLLALEGGTPPQNGKANGSNHKSPIPKEHRPAMKLYDQWVKDLAGKRPMKKSFVAWLKNKSKNVNDLDGFWSWLHDSYKRALSKRRSADNSAVR